MQRRLFPDLCWVLFWLCFGPPGTLKIVLSSRRGATFYKNRRTRSKTEPNSGPKKEPRRPPEGHTYRSTAVLKFSSKFKTILDDLGVQTRVPNGPQNRSKIGLGAQGPP